MYRHTGSPDQPQWTVGSGRYGNSTEAACRAVQASARTAPPPHDKAGSRVEHPDPALVLDEPQNGGVAETAAVGMPRELAGAPDEQRTLGTGVKPAVGCLKEGGKLLLAEPGPGRKGLDLEANPIESRHPGIRPDPE